MLVVLRDDYMLFPRGKADRTSVLEAALTRQKTFSPSPSQWDSLVCGLSSWQRDPEGAAPSRQPCCCFQRVRALRGVRFLSGLQLCCSHLSQGKQRLLRQRRALGSELVVQNGGGQRGVRCGCVVQPELRPTSLVRATPRGARSLSLSSLTCRGKRDTSQSLHIGRLRSEPLEPVFSSQAVHSNHVGPVSCRQRRR